MIVIANTHDDDGRLVRTTMMMAMTFVWLLVVMIVL